MAGIEHGKVTNEEFVEEVARYECVYNRNSKNFKDKNKKANSWEKSAWNLIYLVSAWIFFESKTDVPFGFEADVVVTLGLKEEINLLAASTTCVYIWHFRWTKCMATVGCAIVCDRLRLYGNSSLCDRLRSAIVCDHMETIWKSDFLHCVASGT